MPDPTQAPEGTVPDGPTQTNLDAPIEAYGPPTADVIIDELDPPLPIVDRGFGPTGMEVGLTDEEISAAQAAEETEAEAEVPDQPSDKPADEEAQPPSDTSSEGADVKETPQHVPYERFQEIVNENQRLRESDAVLKWIRENPEQAAARLTGGQTSTVPQSSEERRISLNLEGESPSKPFDQMTEEEQARTAVTSIFYDLLRKTGLDQIADGVNDLFSFKGQVEEAISRNAVDPGGKPLHPRWDELRGTMNEIQSKYKGMSLPEAYALADRMIPQSTPMGDEMAEYNAPAPPPVVPSSPRAQPRKASVAARKAARVASFGRSTPGTTSVHDERMSSEAAAERAIDEFFKGTGE